MVIEDTLQRGYVKKVTSRGDVPENAISLSESEAIKLQLDLIHNWKPKSDVWAFNSGHGLLGAAAAVGGMYFNYYFRRQLHLMRFAQWSTYLPIAGLPAITAPFFHSIFVTADVLINKSSCSLCVETRASVLQMTMGAIYPLFLAPLTAFHFANTYGTYAVPSIKTASNEIFKLWWKFTKPICPQITALLIFQAIIGAYITQKEKESIRKITVHDTVELLD